MKPDSAQSCLSKNSTHAGSCGGRRKRREKMLDASDIRLLMLHFIAQNAAHGYELIKSIEELSKGEYSPSPGIIYPNLTQLEEMAAIQVVDAQASRKAWRIKATGRALLEKHHQRISMLIERLTSLAVLVDNRSIPQVDHAIYQFKTALNSRLSQENISAQALQTIIDALNQAAHDIASS